jgi:hypothetical protein
MPRHEPAGRVTNVWVEGIPEGYTDDDVHWNVQQMAERGDAVAQLALDSVKIWLDMHSTKSRHTRIYLDD